MMKRLGISLFSIAVIASLAVQTAEAAKTQRTKQATTTATTPTNVVVTNPFAGQLFYVDPSSDARKQVTAWQSTRPADAALLETIASQPTAKWLGAWNTDIFSSVDKYVSKVAAAGALPVMVAYNIPNRNCGGYVSSASADSAAYKTWIRQFALGIGSRKAVVILEPDALSMKCVDSTRIALLADAVSVLKAQKGTTVYLDAGHAHWVASSTMADRLTQAGVAKADGFSLNVSNFYTTAENTTYGSDISSRIAGKHFVIDTGRNGNGSNGQWCNPPGRHIGANPSSKTSNGLVDAYVWIKPPGESDGTCNGGPSAGKWWADYALSLVK